VVEEVSIIWPVILLMIISIGIGIVGSGYFYLRTIKHRGGTAS
jgi:hypothetical protein